MAIIGHRLKCCIYVISRDHIFCALGEFSATKSRPWRYGHCHLLINGRFKIMLWKCLCAVVVLLSGPLTHWHRKGDKAMRKTVKALTRVLGNSLHTYCEIAFRCVAPLTNVLHVLCSLQMHCMRCPAYRCVTQLTNVSPSGHLNFLSAQGFWYYPMAGSAMSCFHCIQPILTVTSVLGHLFSFAFKRLSADKNMTSNATRWYSRNHPTATRNQNPTVGHRSLSTTTKVQQKDR